ncbi:MULTISPECIES: PucR family transcriptional regulator [unclassified Nocardia]|uniref:PucR family transcriptional regulator n=1 Tax=unclassified Nocardia TaxID=2637762 RepID=UPI0035DCE7FE
MHVNADVRPDFSTPIRQYPEARAGKYADNRPVRPAGPRPYTAQRTASEDNSARIAIARHCDKIMSDMFAARDVTDDGIYVERLRNSTKNWLRHGISIDTVHRAIREAADRAFERLVGGSTVRDPGHLLGHTRRLFRIHGVVTTIMSSIFVEQIHPGAERPAAHLYTVASALAEGRTAALPADVDIANSYAVLAVSIPRHRDEESGSPSASLVAQRKLGRMQIALDDRTGSTALSTLGVRGGTILIPSLEATSNRLDQLVGELSHAVQVPITAIVLDSTRDGVRASADLAHDLLDVAIRLRYPGGLYRSGDLALEYQLTRPGPARDKLGSLLDPLSMHPDLLHTLLLHIHTNLSRQHTARLLHLHRNTIDYRLHRIQELTGYDPADQTGLWYLQSALVVRAYCRNRAAV